MKKPSYDSRIVFENGNWESKPLYDSQIVFKNRETGIKATTAPSPNDPATI